MFFVGFATEEEVSHEDAYSHCHYDCGLHLNGNNNNI